MHKQEIIDFQNTIWGYYRRYGRNFPWRSTYSGYEIMVSEFMLQQTQTARVKQVYPAFLERFPDIYTLAEAPLSEVLRQWQGLGYYRRARFLHQSAGIIKNKYSGAIPTKRDKLLSLPGVGAATSGSLLAFVHEKPVVFIETNIRRTFIYYFFPEKNKVRDSEIEVFMQ